MASKATHQGHCQCCGALQKLPRGVLSLHGYNISYGFFSGICRGARHQPFEKSFDLIERFIGEARTAQASLRNYQAELRQPAEEAKAFIHVYESAKWSRGHSGYVWREFTIKMTLREIEGAQYAEYYYETQKRESDPPRRFRIDLYTESRFDLARAADPIAVASFLNRQYADSLDTEIARLERYIKWQEYRVANWKPAELLPVDLKETDSQAFAVEEGK